MSLHKADLEGQTLSTGKLNMGNDRDPVDLTLSVSDIYKYFALKKENINEVASIIRGMGK
jgi:hypothetical protein